ncbi:hypothetical protein VTJ49DRAFT_3069 [Mycothermus thermophilus]|uniref:N-acetyltransferase domain-containing protein n=1 Tax=Humicola insolens TaxID=85995 RepID=A0ABR3VNA5_HUMIN
MAFIRPFEPKDIEDAKLICRATLPPSLASSQDATRISPYLWTLPLTHLSPTTCFVLDDGTGRAVGYVIGTPNTLALARDYPRYVAEVLQSEEGRRDVPVPKQLDVPEEWSLGPGRGDAGGGPVVTINPACLAQQAYKVEWLILDGVEGKREMVERYRAMLHINLLEGWRGQGWGRRLIERFVEAVKASGEDYGEGIQLGVSGENTKVVPFYEKMGFRVYPGGEREGCVWMVRELEKN